MVLLIIILLIHYGKLASPSSSQRIFSKQHVHIILNDEVVNYSINRFIKIVKHFTDTGIP